MAEVPRFERKTAFQATAANQSVGGGASVVCNWTTLTYDLGNNFSLANDTYTAPLDGIYTFHAVILCQFTGASTSRHLLQLETTGGGGIWRGSDMSYTAHAANFVVTLWLAATLLLTQGTAVRLRSTSIAGSGYTMIGGGDTFTWSGYRIQTESRTILGG